LIEWISVAATAPLLAYATYSDLRSFYVSDYLWAAGLIVAALINAAGLWLSLIAWVDLLGVAILIGSVLLLGAFTHLGGADKLAIVTVGALNPGLLFSAYYLVTLALTTMVLSVVMRLFLKRGRIPYLPVLSACYLVRLLL
jgi:Flp pilus assembly protein protease CpaA